MPTLSELLHEVDASGEREPPKSKTPLVAHFCSQRPSHSGMAHPNLARAERYHTLATIANRFWAGTILHWAAYTWYWRTDMLDRHSHSFNNIIRKTWYVVFPKDMMSDLIMVSHAVWKTWPEGLSRQKPRPKAEVFVVTEARGPCFSHGMGDHDQILL